MWLCPHCRCELVLDEGRGQWACKNRHSFDRAREGYVNLLPASHKRTAEPGDNSRMVNARRQVHESELFQPLAMAVAGQLEALVAGGSLLEIGCGEGYYSGVLARQLNAIRVGGVDISRPAIRLAAKTYPALQFAVASNFSLPLAPASQQAVVRIFAPAEDSEVCRVLADGGLYLEVGPAPGHLRQLRKMLYESPRPHRESRQSIPGLHLQATSLVKYEARLEQQQLENLVAMTPFAHKGARQRRAQLLALGYLDIELAFSLCLFRKP